MYIVSSIRWGQEQAGMKENEIQIVTLEKQKDTYQVIPPNTDQSLWIRAIYVLSIITHA